MKFKYLILLMLFLLPSVLAFDETQDIETEINIVYDGDGTLLIEDETNDVWEKVFDYNDTFNKTLKLKFEREIECKQDKICNDLADFQKDCTAIYLANKDVSTKLVACEEREKNLLEYKTKFETCTTEKAACITEKANFKKDFDDCEDDNQNNTMWLIGAFAAGAALVYFTQVYKKTAKQSTSDLQADEPRKVSIP